MKILNVEQGSNEWLSARTRYFCASEAAAMMGQSSLMKRNELLHNKKTMSDIEFSDWVQRNIIDKGHEYEAACRPLIEAEIGEELYPMVGVDDSEQYLSSYDGMTMAGAFSWEHKQWNEDLAAQVLKRELGPDHYWQLEHQLLTGGGEFVLFTVSDGTPDRKVSMRYFPAPGRREDLIRGWAQFAKDLEAYIPEAPKVEVVAAPIKNLPAINYTLNGLALKSNLSEYKSAAELLVQESKKPLDTDQDFADREALNKAFGEAEKKIELVKEQVVGEIKDVDAFCRDLSHIGALIREARLNGEKLVKARKDAIRLEIQQKGAKAFADHVAIIDKRLGSVRLPSIQVNFAEVMKGKKTISSLKDAVDTELARAKIEANAIAEKIDANLAALREQAGEYKFLFADVQQIVLKENEDLVALIKNRISDHKQAEQKRLDVERERIRKEEQERADREAAARAKLEAEKNAPKPEPVIQPAPQASTPSITPSEKPKAKGKTAPSSKEIVDVLANHYKVDRAQAINWLRNFKEQEAA